MCLYFVTQLSHRLSNSHKRKWLENVAKAKERQFPCTARHDTTRHKMSLHLFLFYVQCSAEPKLALYHRDIIAVVVVSNISKHRKCLGQGEFMYNSNHQLSWITKTFDLLNIKLSSYAVSVYLEIEMSLKDAETKVRLIKSIDII